MQPSPRGGIAPATAGPAPHSQEGISAPRSGQGECPRPCTRLPCLRRRVSRRCGNARQPRRPFLPPRWAEILRAAMAQVKPIRDKQGNMASVDLSLTSKNLAVSYGSFLSFNLAYRVVAFGDDHAIRARTGK